MTNPQDQVEAVKPVKLLSIRLRLRDNSEFAAEANNPAEIAALTEICTQFMNTSSFQTLKKEESAKKYQPQHNWIDIAVALGAATLFAATLIIGIGALMTLSDSITPRNPNIEQTGETR